MRKDRSPSQVNTTVLGPLDAFLARRSFGAKLGLGFGLLIALVIVNTCVAIYGIVTFEGDQDQIAEPAQALTRSAADAQGHALRALLAEDRFLERWQVEGLETARLRYLVSQRAFDLAQAKDARFRSAAAWTTVARRPGAEDHWAALWQALEETTHQSAALQARLGGNEEALSSELKALNAQLVDLRRLVADRRQRFGQLSSALSDRGYLRNADGLDPERTGKADALRRVQIAVELAHPTTTADDDMAHLKRALAAYQTEHEDEALSDGDGRVDAPSGEHPLALVDHCAATQQQPPSAVPGEASLAEARRLAAPFPDLLHALDDLRASDVTAYRARREAGCAGHRVEDKLHELVAAMPGLSHAANDVVRSAATETASRVALLTVLLAALGATLAYRLKRDIQLPVETLVATAGELARGELGAQALVYSDDEIGELATTFNAMSTRLAKQTAQIAQQMRLIEAEHERSESLLLNILPQPIAQRLKIGERPIADAFDEVTVLFADVVGYTKLSSRLTPHEVVARLSEVFSAFDQIAQRHGVEKIKTIGDAYMAASGLPIRTHDHAHRMATMALDMMETLEQLNRNWPDALELRVGLNTGPVVAGVIGQQKFVYDLWGDAVNVASRMESHGKPGAIHVTAAFAQRVSDRFIVEARGEIEVKGKGLLETYWLIAARPRPNAAAREGTVVEV